MWEYVISDGGYDPLVCRGTAPDWGRAELLPIELHALGGQGGLNKSGSGNALDAWHAQNHQPNVSWDLKFTEADTPLETPPEPFRLEATTVHVILKVAEQPCELGNRLLEFLHSTSILANITKFTAKKFAIKVEAFVENVMCTLKIRIYKSAATYAVEFQRRAGDTVTFSQVYQKARNYLRELFTFEAQPVALPVCSPSQRVRDLDIQEADLTPLLDCAGYCPDLQAESAVGLAELIQDGRFPCSLLSRRVLQAIGQLLQNNRADTALPTARVVNAITNEKAGCELLADHGLLPLILSKTCTGNHLARRELVIAADLIILHCGWRLTAHEVGVVKRELELALQDPLCQRYQLQQPLEQISKRVHELAGLLVEGYRDVTFGTYAQ